MQRRIEDRLMTGDGRPPPFGRGLVEHGRGSRAGLAPVTRRGLLKTVSAIALLPACQPAVGSIGQGRGEPFSDGTFFTDGTGFI